MDNSEIHYLSYDPEEIWAAMMAAYAEAGGDILYPGDEKEMLLRGVQSIVTQCFAGIDSALRMATLRYAVGDYLDIYGESRSCLRIEAAAAEATVEIAFAATGQAKTIPAGTALTADGEQLYLLLADIEQTGQAQTVRAQVQCSQAGSLGNALTAGATMQFTVQRAGVSSVQCVVSAGGGRDAEDDDTYRERIRTYGLTAVTTGPQRQYEAAAKAVTSEILDAQAVQLSAGKVGVYVILKSDAGASGVLADVSAALSASSTRPLTDQVQVARATDIPYTLKLRYKTEAGQDIAAAVAAAISDYQEWQDNVIGQAFNPDRLMAAVYNAGAIRVTWDTGSAFNGDGAVQYTPIGDGKRCKGTITAGVMTDD